MGQRERGAVDEELEALRLRIEHWRRTRTKRTAMPKALWSAAVVLAEERGVHPVARAVKVNYDTLRARVLEAELVRGSGGQEGADAAFVELGVEQVFGVVEATEAVIELVRPGGDQLTVRLPAGDVDIVALSEAFWSRGG